MTTLEALTGCVMWLGVVGCAVTLIGWMITGDIEPLTGVVTLGVVFGLGITGFAPALPQLRPVAAIALFGGIILFPLVRLVLTVRENKAIEVDRLENAYKALGFRPTNPSARFRVAMQAYLLGMSGHAVRIAEKAVQSMPAQLFRDEHAMLNQWRSAVRDPDLFRPISCADCSHSNPPGEVFCSNCGAPFLLHTVQRKIAPEGIIKKLAGVWIVMVALIVGMPLTNNLTTELQVVSIVGMVLTAVGILAFTFREKGAPPA